MNRILRKLKGGDRRSIGRSEEVAKEVLKTPALFADLMEGLFDTDPVIRMRAVDAVEKSTRQRPELLQAWKHALLENTSNLRDKEVRWHIAQLIPRLNLAPMERERAVQILLDYLSDESSIVRTFSMQALADLAQHDDELRLQVTPLIERLIKTGTPAMRTRGCKLLLQLHSLTSGASDGD
jgi:HEAT repeat protein